jgi:hypothetical protein
VPKAEDKTIVLLAVTVTVCVAVANLPEPSITVQVTTVIPKGKAAGALFVTEEMEQLSVAIGIPKTTPVAVQAVFVIVATFTGAVIIGFSLSITVTVWLQGIETFPFWSVAVQTTVVFPIPNK